MRQPRKYKHKPNPNRYSTVWMAYGADCADVESPTRSESHYLATFRTTAQAEDFAADAYNVLIHQCPDWQSLTVFVSETWTAPEGAPVIVDDLFHDLTVSHLEKLVGGSWEAHDTDACSALAPLFGFIGDRKVDVLVTDMSGPYAPDSTTEAITVTVYEYPNGNEIRDAHMGNVTPTPEGVAQAVRILLAEIGVTCQ